MRVVKHVTAERGKPQSIRVDNELEFVSKSLDAQASFNGVKLDFSRPGQRPDNAMIDSLNGRLRDECLTQHWFLSRDEARTVKDAWKEDDNRVRPHAALGNRMPSEFARLTTRLVQVGGGVIKTGTDTGGRPLAAEQLTALLLWHRFGFVIRMHEATLISCHLSPK